VRLLAAACVSAALIGSSAGPWASAAAVRPTVKNPTRIQVVAMEFFYNLSVHSVPPGPAIVQLVNFGQDAHDLRMERIGGSRVYGTPIIQPGDLYNLKLDLLPGTYELWCSVANHRALGMQAQLVVKSRAP
jgi:plastocyanin